MRAESLIFDIDGTLWDSRSLVAEGYNIQLRQENLSHLCVTADTLKPLFGKTMAEIADALFPTVPPARRYPLMERCMDTEQRHLRRFSCADLGYPHVARTLEALAPHHRLFLVSNSQQGYPELTMEKLGIASLFQGWLCFGDTGTDKGHTILRLMQQHHISSAVYIGDTQGDLEAARVAGIPFVWAAYGFGTPAEYDGIIHTFSQLTELMEPWN